MSQNNLLPGSKSIFFMIVYLRDYLNWNRRNQGTWNETNKITGILSSYKEKFIT